VLHEGDVLTGPGEVTETVEPGLEPGDYFFVCDVHPATMTGVLEITEGEGGGDEA
jgi:plastocyanin